ncbi:MAG TPA: hypothetical protein VHF51_07905 [Solirubrobacteraceae bacterium]|nr:hypothetical protein [Solirubrobacteraceae bacterium]
MKLLELQPELAPGVPPEPPEDAPREEPQADPGARTCTSCGAEMEPGQDWCLACGTASGPLGERAGWRPAMTVLGLTLVLVAGAVAASYAALRSDPAPPATSTAQVAQAPTVTTPPPTATTSPPDTTPTTPRTSTGRLPKVQVPSNRPSTTAPRSATPAPVTPAPAPRTSTPPAQTSPAPSSGSSGRTNSTTTDTTPRTPPPAAIDLDASAASLYDPYRRATAVGVPGKALDGDGGTSWYVDPAPGDTVALGYALDLGQSRGIKSVDITTPTPGFRVEVYATDEATPPPTILDTRWAHIRNKSNVGEGGKAHIVLGAGTSKYRTLLLWITEPPADGARVRISELKVFG